MGVDELQRCTSAYDFAEWWAFQDIDPSSEDRADLRAAITTAAVVNSTHRGKGARTARPIDFMPYAERPETNQKAMQEAVHSWGMSMVKRQKARGKKRGKR